MSTVEQFLAQLRQSGLLPEAELRELEEGLPAGSKQDDAQQLAKRLVHGPLSVEQAVDYVLRSSSRVRGFGIPTSGRCAIG